MDNTYSILKQAHQKEVNEFPMAFAFSDKQFEEGMKKLGLKPTDTDKVYSFGNTGGFYKRTDAPKLKEMFDRHEREMKEAIEADETGNGFIYDMFVYELGNHEYIITYSTSDTLDALGLTHEEVKASQKLSYALDKAKRYIIDNSDY